MSSYRRDSEVGDIVVMKGGDLAVVTDMDILCGGHVKELTLYPLVGMFRRVWLFFSDQLRPAEEQIEGLKKVGALALNRPLY